MQLAVISALLLLGSSAAKEVCDGVKEALNNYAQHQCVYKDTIDTFEVIGTSSSSSPRVTLNRIPPVDAVKNLAFKSIPIDIAADAFDNLDDVKSLLFQNNHVDKFPAKQISKLNKLTSVYFLDNPLAGSLTINLAEVPRSLLLLRLDNSNVAGFEELEEMPDGLRSIGAYGNNLPAFVMEPTGYPYDMVELSLSGNRIREYRTPGLNNLKVLFLGDNLLGEVSGDMLQGLATLDYLSLTRNRIEVIEPGAFAHTPELTFLDLEHNNIRVLSDDIALPKLNSLRVSGNRLQYLPLQFFVRSSKLTRVRFHGNPLNCGCLEDLLYWTGVFRVEIGCRQRSFGGIAPACVVHANSPHYCPYQYYEEDATYFIKKRYSKLLNESREC